MSRFKFVHAADLHLDSPLIGLSRKSSAFAGRVERASRAALDNLVGLVLEEEASLLLLAGDVFDGELRDFQTGLYFTAALRRLEAAGVRVFLIAGNHDADNRYASRLRFSANVHLFSAKAPESIAVEALDVVVHGYSFPQRDVVDNIALGYPAPVAGRFNIGLLHTACAGAEGPHMRYAPCTVEQLVNHGYDYWALGHVHARAVLNAHPHVVYPGNLQGRHPRETGAKGATLVEVEDGRVIACEHRALDVVRWASLEIDIGAAPTRPALLEAVRAAAAEALSEAGDRPLAARLRLTGAGPLHAGLTLDPTSAREDVEALLAGLPGDAWLERLDIATSAPARPGAVDPSVGGQLAREIAALAQAAPDLLEECLGEIRAKLPANARLAELFSRLREAAPAQGVELAASLVAGESDAV